MRKLLITVGILILALMVGLRHKDDIKELRSVNSQLKSQAEEISKLESEITQLEAINVDTNALEKLHDETVELMRLRAEAARLRPLAKKKKPELQGEIEQRKSARDRAQVALDYENNWTADAAISQLMTRATDIVSKKMSEYIGQNERFPVSMETFRQDISELNDLLESAKSRGELNQIFLENVMRIFRPEDFELISPPTNIDNWSELTIVLKETNPRELLNGGWERNYGILIPNTRLSDFNPYPFYVYTKTVELEGDDFEEWEQEFAKANSEN